MEFLIYNIEFLILKNPYFFFQIRTYIEFQIQENEF